MESQGENAGQNVEKLENAQELSKQKGEEKADAATAVEADDDTIPELLGSTDGTPSAEGAPGRATTTVVKTAPPVAEAPEYVRIREELDALFAESQAPEYSLHCTLPSSTLPAFPREKPLEERTTLACDAMEAIIHDKGLRGLERAYQVAVARANKLQGELAVATRRADTARRGIQQLVEDYSRLHNRRTTMANDSVKMIELIVKCYSEFAEDDKAWHEKIKDVQSRVDSAMLEQRQKIKEAEQHRDDLEATNAALRAELEQEKNTYYAASSSMNAECQQADAEAKEVSDAFAAAFQESAVLEGRLLSLRRQHEALDASNTELKRHGTIMTDRLGELEPSAPPEADVVTIVEKSRQQQLIQIQHVLDEREAAVNEKREIDRQTAAIRTQIASLKKRIATAEKNKNALELACRELQSELRQSAPA